jgi:hypothetical protein
MEKQIIISEKQANLRDKLLAVMDKKNLKAAEIARITGRSEGTISDLLRNKKSFDKVLNVIYDSLKDYMGDDELVPTRQYNKMWNIAKAGKQLSDMRLVVGNTGIGKSVVFKKFSEENETCYYLKIDRKEMTWNQFLQKVTEKMGLKLERNRKHFGRFSTSYLLDKIIAFVEEKADSNPQLIIDESEFARNTFFKELKGLYTATEGLLSIVVVGITDVMTRIGRMAGLEYRQYQTANGYNYRWYPTKENSNIYTTFARRISVFRIDNISTEDIAAFCTEKGITNKKVIELAAARWWNYDEADRAIKRAQRMGLNLATITPEEFEVL